jgi:hypothetical protein
LINSPNLLHGTEVFVPFQVHKRFEYKYSFKPPYLAQKDGTVPFFEYTGSEFTILDVDGCCKKAVYPGADFLYIFSRENSSENFSPKNVGKNCNFPRKKF